MSSAHAAVLRAPREPSASPPRPFKAPPLDANVVKRDGEAKTVDCAGLAAACPAARGAAPMSRHWDREQEPAVSLADAGAAARAVGWRPSARVAHDIQKLRVRARAARPRPVPAWAGQQVLRPFRPCRFLGFRDQALRVLAASSSALRVAAMGEVAWLRGWRGYFLWIKI